VAHDPIGGCTEEVVGKVRAVRGEDDQIGLALIRGREDFPRRGTLAHLDIGLHIMGCFLTDDASFDRATLRLPALAALIVIKTGGGSGGRGGESVNAA